MAFNRAPSNPSDQIVSLGDLYTKIKVPNRLFNALDLFSIETHDTLNVSLDRLLDRAEQVFNENVPFSSDFNTILRPTFSNYLFQLPYFSSVDELTSRDLERFRRAGTDSDQSLQQAKLELVEKQVIEYFNTKDKILSDSVLRGVSKSKYAGQGDLNYFTEFAGTTQTNIEFDFAASASVPMQLDALIQKSQLECAGKNGDVEQRFIICAGELAQQLRYHASITETMIYNLSTLSADNFLTQYKELLPAYQMWYFKNLIFIDITGQNAQYGVGDNGGYMVTKFNRNSKVHVHHAGPAIKSAFMVGEQSEFLQYMLPVNKWGFPTVVSEFSMLAVNNLPQSTFSLSIKA
ncbi:TPA: major capsid protein [Yersinia enterocolitica]|uniref:major capsid protein n=1 Tax=Yersinia enterocolitica TaxID=630 RepID=UPI002AC48EF1|nr:major capsid protein [Yersinia enterocolitica]HDL6768439.1 major capsid protein [Yersinia enterocolitica]HEN3562210.1 major capsid protein [Yersinia enterocolitica]